MRQLEFDRVTVRYGSIDALAQASFTCAAGKVTCLAGPNGAGKSTALAAAAGVIRISSGRISAGSAMVAAHHPKRGTAYLPQDSAFPRLLTAREILRFAASATGAHDANWSAALNVTGVEQVMAMRAGSLSGGWQRRLGLAWTLLQPGDLLLLDEPLAGLDPDTLDLLIEHIGKRAAAGDTVVMATHEFEALEALNPDLVVLDRGRVVSNFPAGAARMRELYRAALRQVPDARPETLHV